MLVRMWIKQNPCISLVGTQTWPASMEIGTVGPQETASRPIILPSYTDSQYLLKRGQVSISQRSSCVHVHHSTIHNS